MNENDELYIKLYIKKIKVFYEIFCYFYTKMFFNLNFKAFLRQFAYLTF